MRFAFIVVIYCAHQKLNYAVALRTRPLIRKFLCVHARTQVPLLGKYALYILVYKEKLNVGKRSGRK